MHRPLRVRCSRTLTVLLTLAAFLGFGAARALAQDGKTTTIVVPINGSQVLEMSKKQRIKSIDNSEKSVAEVEILAGSDFRKVMIRGGAVAGLSKLVLTGADDVKESFTILVELNVEFLKRVLAQAAPTANIQIIQGTGGTIILTGTVAKADDIDLVIRTAVGAVGNASQVVNGLRVGGVQQVQLDVVIARVARSEGRSMGFSFLHTGTNNFLTSTVGGGGTAAGSLTNAVGNAAATLSGAPNIAFGIINDNSAFLGFLEALRTESLVKVMAQPKVSTLSGKPAQFISGGKQAIPTLASGSAGGGAVSGVELVPFGTTVNFLPIVLGGGKIYLEVEPAFEFPDPTPLFSAPIPGTSGSVFGRTTQSIKTSAVLEDGQTLAIGGMIFNSINGNTTKVPVLGDLPFLGTAFSKVQYSNSEEEMLILITPHLVDAMACNQLPKFLPGEETRSPDDFELFLERILEAPRGPRDVFCGHTYVPAYKSGPTADLYPCPGCCGPRGTCDLGALAGPACHPNCGGPGGCQSGQCGQCGVGGSGAGVGAGQPVHSAPAAVKPASQLPQLVPVTTAQPQQTITPVAAQLEQPTTVYTVIPAQPQEPITVVPAQTAPVQPVLQPSASRSSENRFQVPSVMVEPKATVPLAPPVARGASPAPVLTLPALVDPQ